MKTGITFKNIEYIVNTKKKVVVCIIKADILSILYKCVGIAKCSEEDTFDEIKGKRIAESRAKTRIYKEAEKLYRGNIKQIIKINTECINRIEFCRYLYEKEKEHIHKLCEE